MSLGLVHWRAMDPVTISTLSTSAATERLDELADLLLDAVAHGASVNFLDDLSAAEARTFWADAVDDVARGRQILLAAMVDGRIVGTVMLALAPQPNQQHRADVNKLLVHSIVRRRGIGAALLAAVEDEADRRGRTLLMLDTVKGSDGERLYASHDWVRYGEVPDHALLPDGAPEATSFFYKRLR
jgi:GNAT superfamily N-acetyltransferase